MFKTLNPNQASSYLISNPAFVSSFRECSADQALTDTARVVHLSSLRRIPSTLNHTLHPSRLWQWVWRVFVMCATQNWQFSKFSCAINVYSSPPTNSDLQMNTIDLDWKDHNSFTTDITTIWKFGSDMLKCILGYSFLLKGCGTPTTSCTDRKFRPVNTVTHMTSIDKSQYWLAHGDCKF
jgi:hypothetical protein